MNSFLRDIKNKVLVFDGSKGTMLQKFGLKGGDCPELWNVTHADEVKKVYSMYRDAGADVIQTNTFQGNSMKLEEYGIGERTYELNYVSVQMAKEVMKGKGYVAASIGPLGKLFEPSGELTFEKAYEVFAEQVKAVADGGADIINFETFTDLKELTAALLAARNTVELPVICSMAFEQNGRSLMGNSPETVVQVLKSHGAAMAGTNCSMGPGHLAEIVKKMHYAGGGYLCVKPNAGLPKIENGEVVYMESPEKFAFLVSEFVKYGARLIGGCCGTSPEYIKALKNSLDKIEIPEIDEGVSDMLVSSTKTLDIGSIGKEDIGHIDASDDTELMSCLQKGDMSIIEDMVLDIAAEGYKVLQINVDTVKKDKMLLANVVKIAQGYIKEPLIIETRNPEALEEALKLYCGRAGVLKSGMESSEDKKIEEIAIKYGAVILSSVT